MFIVAHTIYQLWTFHSSSGLDNHPSFQ